MRKPCIGAVFVLGGKDQCKTSLRRVWSSSFILFSMLFGMTRLEADDVRGLLSAGKFSSDLIDESSGLLESRRFPGIFWTHNDSGDKARIFAVHRDGSLVIPAGLNPHDYHGVALEGMENQDFEDITWMPGGLMVVGDIGNNANQRRNLVVHIFKEPNPFEDTSVRVKRTVGFFYPEQSGFPPPDRNFDAEALFWSDGHLHLLTKHRADTWSKLYRFADLNPAATTGLELLGSFQAGGMVTAADTCPEELNLGILTYSHLWLFRRTGADQNYFQGEIRRLALHAGQCEGLAFSGDELWISNEEGELFRILLSDIPLFSSSGDSFWQDAKETRQRISRGSSTGTESKQTAQTYLILNEYNSVRHNRWLEADGLAAARARDSRLGRVKGNGGNWFELVVVGAPDHSGYLDMRGWWIDWRQDNQLGTIELADRPQELARLRVGTILTVGEEVIMKAEDGTNVVNGSRFPAGGTENGTTEWVHLWTGDKRLVRTGHRFSDAENTNENFQVRIRDNRGLVVMDWTGEGRQPTSGVSSREVFHLESDPNCQVTPDHPAYTDSVHSSFGKPNRWRRDGKWYEQDLSRLRQQERSK